LDEQVEKRKEKYKRLTAFSATFKVAEKGGACVVFLQCPAITANRGKKLSTANKAEKYRLAFSHFFFDFMLC
jgi:hypothetical protein